MSRMLQNQARAWEINPGIKATAYQAAPRVVGGLMRIDARPAGGAVTLRRFTVVDAANVKSPLDIYVFNVAPTTFNDDVAFAPVLADVRNLIDVISLAGADYVTVNGLAYGIRRDLGIDMTLPSGSIWLYAVTNTGTPSYGSTTALYFEVTAWVY